MCSNNIQYGTHVIFSSSNVMCNTLIQLNYSSSNYPSFVYYVIQHLYSTIYVRSETVTWWKRLPGDTHSNRFGDKFRIIFLWFRLLLIYSKRFCFYNSICITTCTAGWINDCRVKMHTSIRRGMRT